MKKISALLLTGVLTLSMGACAMLQPDEATSNMDHNEPNITVGELQDGKIKTCSYNLVDLNCTIIDESGNEVYTGPVTDASQTRDKIETGHTVYWFPKDNENGFHTPNAGTAVSISFATNKKLSKTIGLTNGGGSSSSTDENPSAILYTGSEDYWRVYMKNDSSETICVESGMITWNE